MKKVDMLILTKHMYTMTGEGVGYLADSERSAKMGEELDGSSKS